MSYGVFKQTIEIRYENGFRLWDTAGALTSNLIAAMPELKVKQGSPERIIFEDKKRRIGVTVGLNSSQVDAFMQVCSPTAFYEVCEGVFTRTLDELNIEVLTRIGHRILFHRKCAQKEQAGDSIRSAAKILGIATSLGASELLKSKTLQDFRLRFEDGKIGISIRGTPVTLQIDFEGPLPDELSGALPPTVHAAEIDTDVYTLGIVNRRDFLPTEFLKANLRMLDTEILSRISKDGK